MLGIEEGSAAMIPATQGRKILVAASELTEFHYFEVLLRPGRARVKLRRSVYVIDLEVTV